MATKCCYCFTRFQADELLCRICKIDRSKNKSLLTPEEKGIAYRCRTLYTVGFLNIVGGLMGLFLLLPTLFFVLGHQKNRNLGTPSVFLPYYAMAMFVLLGFAPIFGLALRRYKKWCYPAGIALYLLLILLYLPGLNLFPVGVASLCLYWIASEPSPKILSA